MLTLTATIEDVHGNRYENAVILINSINYTANQSLQSALDLSKTPPDRTPVSGQNTLQLNFNAYLYPNAQAVIAKKVPMVLRSKSGPSSDWHTITLPEAISDTSTFEAVCEAYVMSTIVPQLAVIEGN